MSMTVTSTVTDEASELVGWLSKLSRHLGHFTISMLSYLKVTAFANSFWYIETTTCEICHYYCHMSALHRVHRNGGLMLGHGEGEHTEV